MMAASHVMNSFARNLYALLASSLSLTGCFTPPMITPPVAKINAAAKPVLTELEVRALAARAAEAQTFYRPDYKPTEVEFLGHRKPAEWYVAYKSADSHFLVFIADETGQTTISPGQ